MRQSVAERFAQGLRGRLGAACEIAGLLVFIAPLTVGIPVPCVDGQFRVLAIGDRAPVGGKRFLQDRFAVDGVELFLGKYVHRSAHGLIGVKLDGFGWSNVGANGLRASGGNKYQCEDLEKQCPGRAGKLAAKFNEHLFREAL